MEKNYQFLKMDINKPINRKLTAMQYDNKTRYILVSVFSNFIPYDLTYTTVKIYGIKGDKTVFFNNAKIVDAKAGKFEIDLTEQCLVVEGDVEIQILILGASEERLSSNSFILNVKKNIINPIKVTSQDEFKALIEGLSSLAEYDIYKNNVHRHDAEIKDNTNKINIINETLLKKGFVTYKEFGAVLDGVTDDTESIKKCHNFANENGLSVVQNNSVFVLSDTIEVRTNLDLSGSTVIGKMDDVDIPYDRVKSYYAVVGKELKTVTLSDLTPPLQGETTLNIGGKNGFLSFEGSGVYMDRIVDGVVSDESKWESNYINNGKLSYPIINTHNKSELVLKLREDDSYLYIKAPKFTLRRGETKAYSLFSIQRNNVTIDGLYVCEENNNSNNYVTVYTPIHINRCCNININNTISDALGSSDNKLGISYFILFELCCNINANNCKQSKIGWSGINGNWFRDIKVNNCELLSCSGHIFTTDISIKDSILYNGIEVHGTGFIDVENTTFYDKGISTKLDYAGEFRGTFNIRNCRAYNMQRFVYLFPPAHGHKIIPSMPNINIDGLTFETDKNDNSIVYFGYLDNLTHDVFLTKSIKLKNIDVVTSKRHSTLKFSFNINDKSKFGYMDIECDNLKINDSTYLTNEWFGEYSNFLVPKVLNNFRFNLKIKNSLFNLGLMSNSLNAEVENCKVVILRTIDGYTAVSNIANIYFNNCEFIRPYCNFPPNDYNVVVKNCIYKKGNDNKIADGFAEIIKFASGNASEAGAIIREIDKPKMYNYNNSSFWENK